MPLAVRCAEAAVLALILAAAPAGALELKLRQALDWSVEAPDFGGFSGLVVADGGREAWAVSDGGTLWRTAIDRDAEGKITGLRAFWRARLMDNMGAEVSGFTEDAEALAAGPEGKLFVGYESYTRITGLTPPDMRPEALHRWDLFDDEWNNQGFEGLARLPDGRLLAVIEARDDGKGGYRTFLGQRNDWRPGPVLRSGGGFGASDATVDAQGRLWLLERRLTWLGQFEVRISTCPIATEGVVDCAPVLLVEAGTLGNMEGLSVWQDAAGRSFMTLISDDNFSMLSSTTLAEYEILP